jgi:hypothetical protein
MKRIRQLQRRPQRGSRRLKLWSISMKPLDPSATVAECNQSTSGLSDWTDAKRYRDLYEIAPVGFFYA